MPSNENFILKVNRIMEAIEDPSLPGTPSMHESPLREKLKDMDSILELFLIDTPLDPIYDSIDDYRAMLFSKLERYMVDLGEILNLDVE
jgi:hypothetical protein